jgi:hypothetical protein
MPALLIATIIMRVAARMRPLTPTVRAMRTLNVSGPLLMSRSERVHKRSSHSESLPLSRHNFPQGELFSCLQKAVPFENRSHYSLLSFGTSVASLPMHSRIGLARGELADLTWKGGPK